MLETLTAFAGRIAPAGWKETLVWAAKTAVSTFLGVVTVAQLLSWDVSAIDAGAAAAVTAGANVVLNRIAAWAATRQANHATPRTDQRPSLRGGPLVFLFSPALPQQHSPPDPP